MLDTWQLTNVHRDLQTNNNCDLCRMKWCTPCSDICTILWEHFYLKWLHSSVIGRSNSVRSILMLHSVLQPDPSCQALWLSSFSLTLIEPVCDAVEDDPLLSRRREPPGAALNICLVVNVVFKYVNLWDREKKIVFILQCFWFIQSRMDLNIKHDLRHLQVIEHLCWTNWEPHEEVSHR